MYQFLKLKCGITTALLGLTLSLGVHAETLRLGTMPVGSGWYVAGAAMQKVVAASSNDLRIEILARGGGVANPMVVEAGRAQLAISNVATSRWAAEGKLLYEGQQATRIRSLVGGLNPVFIGAIVRNDYMTQHGFKTLKEIFESGKPVNIMMKPPGSNIPPVVDLILEAHNTSRAKIAANGGRIIQVDSSQMAGMIRDGRVDLFFDTILRGHPSIQEITLTGNVSFLDLSDEAIQAISGIGLQRGEIPQWFDIQTSTTLGGDYGTHLIARADMSEETAYQITKLVIENMDKIAAEFPAWRAFKLENAALPENNGIPLHPGAIRYYQEIGLL